MRGGKASAHDLEDFITYLMLDDTTGGSAPAGS